MTLEIDLDLTDLTEADLEGGGGVAPGRYHAQVTGVSQEADGRTPYLALKLLVLAGTVAGQTGLTHTERLYLSDKATKRLAIFARRLGLISADDFGSRTRPDWEAAVGRQVVVEVVEESYTKTDGTKGKSSKLTFAGIWPVTDERVKDVPKDAQALAGNGPPPKGGAARVTADEDDYSDI
jgi:hypothetical protein